jgi:peroxiredoxin
MGKLARSVIYPATMGVVIVFSLIGSSWAQITPGQPAPMFTLKDTQGESHDLSGLRGHAMIVLYFFDVKSRPSQEGLLSLHQLVKQYEDADLTVWGVTRSSKEEVAKFMAQINLDFPVLLDNSGVSDLYQARFILPTVCVLGPNLNVLDYHQGGGKITEISLQRLAERELRRKLARLKVDSVPVGAQVFVEGSFKGKTPLKLELSLGKYELRISLPDYYEWEAQLELDQEAEVPLFVQLMPVETKSP